jgi:hypothetical protein
MIAHNGEINTLRGNYNWMRAREKGTSSPLLGADLEKIWPLIYSGQSDSASFDNALELLVMGGYLAGARNDDADSRSLGVPYADGRAARGLLQVPRGDDRALGRSGGGRLHRWAPDRRHPRS